MKKLRLIYCLILLLVLSNVNADEQHLQSAHIEGNDTVATYYLHEIFIYPPMQFKNKKQERFYWRTVRDVKLTLPIAKILTKEMIRTDSVMSTMSRKERRRFWKQYERLLYTQYEAQFRDMTAVQGQMLMLLIDRESGQTSYNVIKKYKGGFVAGCFQILAKMFGNDLKAEYDGNDKDQIVERVITLVEAGQL